MLSLSFRSPVAAMGKGEGGKGKRSKGKVKGKGKGMGRGKGNGKDLQAGMTAEAPTVDYLANLCGFRQRPEVGDQFLSKGGSGRPCCIEYTLPAPRGERLGSLPQGTRLVAKEIDVARIPPSHDKPAEWGICIRCESHLIPGTDVWVNVSRGTAKFALLC